MQLNCVRVHLWSFDTKVPIIVIPDLTEDVVRNLATQLYLPGV